jgi:oxalate decarboxylase/phosphoglucose isomerase-like protein (cupin superfamily)
MLLGDTIGKERGHHYHGKKTENFYALTGEFDLLVHDLETGHKEVFVVKGRRSIANCSSDCPCITGPKSIPRL